MKKILLALLLAASTASAQYQGGYKPGTGTSGGGAPTFPLATPANGCVTASYGFSDSLVPSTWGLCLYDTDQMRLQSTDTAANRTAFLQIYRDSVWQEAYDNDFVGAFARTETTTDGWEFNASVNNTADKGSQLQVRPGRLRAFSTGVGVLNANYSLELNDVASGDFLTFTDVATPSNVITLARDTSAASLSLNAQTTNNWVYESLNGANGSYTVSNANSPAPTNFLYTLSLDDSTGPSTFLSFSDVATPANQITLAQDTVAPSLTFTVADAAQSAFVQFGANGLSATTSVAVATVPSLTLRDFTSNDFLTFTNVATPAKTITFAQDSSIPILTTTVTDGTQSVVVTADASGNGHKVEVSDGAGQTTYFQVDASSAAANSTDGLGFTGFHSTGPQTVQAGITDGVDTAQTTLKIRGFSASYVNAGVASAATIAPKGNVFHVTGTVNIDTISTTDVATGTCYTLIFDDVLTVGDLTGNINLSAAFVSTADDTLTVCHDGTTWYETARSVN